MRLTAGLFAALFLGAGPASAQTFLETVAPCAMAQDRPMCILKALAAKDGGSGIWRDRELRSEPAIMAALGLTAEGVAAARGMSEGERIFSAAGDEGEVAADEARALDRTGRPPSEALAPILALSTANPSVPAFFMGDGELPSPRAEAYLRLLVTHDARSQPPSRPLGLAAADAWERDIRDPAAPAGFKDSARPLALARAALRDEAGLLRAIALIPSPVERIEVMADIGDLEQAAQAALALPRQEVVAFVRAEMDAFAQRTARARQEAARAASAAMPAQLRELGLDKDPEFAKALRELEKEEARAIRHPAPVPRIPASEIENEADGRIASLHDSILRAALRKGRADAVRPLADRVLQDDELPKNRYRFPLVLKTATPEAARARLDALDAALSPARGADRLEPLVQAWLEMGRPDRAEGLVDRAAGWARAGSARRPSPYAPAAARLLWMRGRQAEALALGGLRPSEKLKLDIAAGRGLAGYDTYFAETDEAERISFIVGCDYAAAEARAWSVALACIEKKRTLLTEPSQRHATAGPALDRAAGAADAGELAIARRLFDIAAEDGVAGLAADPRMRTWPDPFAWGTLNLIAVAKAELRADGRLPKSPPPPTP